MLPKINQKIQGKDIVPYHTFAREVMRRKNSQNNISKLKLLKQYLDEEQYLKPLGAPQFRVRNNNRNKQLLVNQSFTSQRPRAGKNCGQKQNKHKDGSKARRKSLTSETHKSQNRQSQVVLYYKDRSALPTVPVQYTAERIKLNQLFSWKGKFSNNAKQIFNNSIRISHKLNTYRIL